MVSIVKLTVSSDWKVRELHRTHSKWVTNGSPMTSTRSSEDLRMLEGTAGCLRSAGCQCKAQFPTCLAFATRISKLGSSSMWTGYAKKVIEQPPGCYLKTNRENNMKELAAPPHDTNRTVSSIIFPVPTAIWSSSGWYPLDPWPNLRAIWPMFTCQDWWCWTPKKKKSIQITHMSPMSSS